MLCIYFLYYFIQIKIILTQHIYIYIYIYIYSCPIKFIFYIWILTLKMGKKCVLEKVKWQIVGLLKTNMSNKEITKKVGVLEKCLRTANIK